MSQKQVPDYNKDDKISFIMKDEQLQGTIRWIGESDKWIKGTWIGIELDAENLIYGHNGYFNEERFFVCPDKYGIYIQEPQIIKIIPNKDEESKSAVLSDNSKRALSAAYLVSNIIDQKLKSKPYELKNEECESILSNVLITGGAPRDFLLSKPINDIDIMIDTFRLKQLNIDHDHEITFDAEFFANIIKEDVNLKDVISVKQSDRAFQFEIIKDFEYNDINLKGQEIDLLNPYQRDWNNQFLNDEEKQSEEIIKKYGFNMEEVTVEDCMKVVDFSMNTLKISLKDILKLKDDIYNWNDGVIKNGIDSDICDGIRDIKNCVINTPLSSPVDSLLIVKPHGHFWRLIKICVKLKNFKIDESLVEDTIKTYDLWLNEEFFIKQEKYKKFVDKVCGLYVKGIDDYRHMLEMWDLLEFNTRLNKMFTEFGDFKEYFVAAIKKNNNDIEIQNSIFLLLNQYKYSAFTDSSRL